MMDDIVIAGAVRTPIGRFGGDFVSLTAVQLGAIASRAALERTGIAPDQVDQTIFGHARQAGCGPNPARQVAIHAGIPVARPAFTINQACLSGLQAVFAAARAIRCGESEVVLAGGMEAMSRVPFLVEGRWGLRMGHAALIDAMHRDGFLDPLCGQLMGQTAETLAKNYAISRREQDEFAACSQQRCERAELAQRFVAEIVPVDLAERSGTRRISRDESPRGGVTADSLARLPPVFDPDGSVTAGNSCSITDGAAALVVMSADAARRLDVRPMARLRAWNVAGVDPAVMGLGPVPAVRELLHTVGLDLAAIELVELNEAFAAQVLAVDRELHFDPERLNVNGGAIALGHPIGCSGTRILVSLLHEMQRRDVRRGLATLCVSGGLGGAILVER